MNVTRENAAHAIESWGTIRLDGRQGHHVAITFFCLHEVFARRVASFFPRRMGSGGRSVRHYPAGHVRASGIVNESPAWAFDLATIDAAAMLAHARPALCQHHRALADNLIELGRIAGDNLSMSQRVRRGKVETRYSDVEKHVEGTGSQALFRDAKKLLATARAMCPVPRNAWPGTAIPDPELVLG